MKRFKIIFTFTFLAIIGLACNSEDNNIEKENSKSTLMSSRISPTNENDAKKLHSIMIQSLDYSEYKIARNAFVRKLYGNGVFFNSKEEYISWISTNLPLTKFTSISEFESMLDDMVSKYSVLMNNNPELFLLLNSADERQFIQIIEPSLGEVPTLSKMSPCSDTCISSCETTLNNIEEGYGALYAQYGGNPFANSVIDAMYWSNYQGAVDDLNDCISAC